jgi:hypothetical protein
VRTIDDFDREMAEDGKMFNRFFGCVISLIAVTFVLIVLFYIGAGALIVWIIKALAGG